MKRLVCTFYRGQMRVIYDDALLPLLSQAAFVHTRRASHVEPDGSGWSADMSPMGGPKSEVFRTRHEALQWEMEWLTQQRLCINQQQGD